MATGEVYRDLLQNTINLIIISVTHKDENLIVYEVAFQQDWAPPHCYVRVREYQNNGLVGNGRFSGLLDLRI